MYSAGSAGGSGWPAMATSMRCMARMNSSAVSFPSWSMSDRFLPTRSAGIRFPETRAGATHASPKRSRCLVWLQANEVSVPQFIKIAPVSHCWCR